MQKRWFQETVGTEMMVSGDVKETLWEVDLPCLLFRGVAWTTLAFLSLTSSLESPGSETVISLRKLSRYICCFEKSCYHSLLAYFHVPNSTSMTPFGPEHASLPRSTLKLYKLPELF